MSTIASLPISLGKSYWVEVLYAEPKRLERQRVEPSIEEWGERSELGTSLFRHVAAARDKAFDPKTNGAERSSVISSVLWIFSATRWSRSTWDWNIVPVNENRTLNHRRQLTGDWFCNTWVFLVWVSIQGWSLEFFKTTARPLPAWTSRHDIRVWQLVDNKQVWLGIELYFEATSDRYFLPALHESIWTCLAPWYF